MHLNLFANVQFPILILDISAIFILYSFYLAFVCVTYVCVHPYVCMHVYVHGCTYMCACTCVHSWVHQYHYACVHASVRVSACMHGELFIRTWNTDTAKEDGTLSCGQ